MHETRVSDIAPARYFPPERGRYDVAPGLSRFGRDFGNGPADANVFQVDCRFRTYRDARLRARAERLSKYYRTHDLHPAVAATVTRFIARRLAAEHPRLFALSERTDEVTLGCDLTGETLGFDALMRLREAMASNVVPPYADALDALACQMQEDLAIVSTRGDDRHWLSAIHLCFPNHWAAGDKIGRTFADVHAPVAGMGPMNARQVEFVRAMIAATDGLVRFAWGVTTDDRLNHHPEPPPDVLAEAWRGRAFDPANSRAFVRVERQTIWGFPDAGAALFTIRTYFVDVADVRQDKSQRSQLVAAIESMSPASQLQ
jgi:dimethylamine monooxygenase subunit A